VPDVGINTYAMTANQTWFEGKKFHLVPAAFRTAWYQYSLRILANSLTKAILISRCEFSITGSLCYFYGRS
jgi:hypothetical protein